MVANFLVCGMDNSIGDLSMDIEVNICKVMDKAFRRGHTPLHDGSVSPCPTD